MKFFDFLQKKKKDVVTHVSILGSCVCRDAFSIPFETCNIVENEIKYKVDRFVQSINTLSAISEPIEESLSTKLLSEIKLSTACEFYKKCFALDITKTWDKYLLEVKSDWLVVDFSPIRLDCKKIGKTFVTIQDLGSAVIRGLPKSESEAAIETIKSGEDISLADLSDTELKDICSRYIDRILDIYPQNKIIVVETKYTSTFIDDEKNFLSSPDHFNNYTYRRGNYLMNLAYRCAKEKMPKAHFIDAIPTLVGNAGHKWGKGGLHFVDEIYLYIYQSIDCIIHSHFSRLREKLYIQSLCDKYSKKIFDKYTFIVTQNIQLQRNLLNYSLGMNQGVYERDGVTLIIKDDYTFFIKGKATKDITFYLYQGDKNPLGGWKSVQSKILPGNYVFSTNTPGSLNDFYIQLVLTTESLDKKWIVCNYSKSFQIDTHYDYTIVRAIILKDTSVDIKGRLTLEKNR